MGIFGKLGSALGGAIGLGGKPSPVKSGGGVGGGIAGRVAGGLVDKNIGSKPITPAPAMPPTSTRPPMRRTMPTRKPTGGGRGFGRR